MGKHANRARLYDARGAFLATITPQQARRLLDFGYASRIGRSLPLRIQLRFKEHRQLRAHKPTSGVTGYDYSAVLTARCTEGNAEGEYLKRVIAMLILSVRGWAPKDIARELGIGADVVTNTLRNWPVTRSALSETTQFDAGDISHLMKCDHDLFIWKLERLRSMDLQALCTEIFNLSKRGWSETRVAQELMIAEDIVTYVLDLPT